MKDQVYTNDVYWNVYGERYEDHEQLDPWCVGRRLENRVVYIGTFFPTHTEVLPVVEFNLEEGIR